MSQHMVLVYEEEVDPAEQAEREQVTLLRPVGPTARRWAAWRWPPY